MPDEIIPPNPAPKRDSWGPLRGMPPWAWLIALMTGGGTVPGFVGMFASGDTDALGRIESKLDALDTKVGKELAGLHDKDRVLTSSVSGLRDGLSEVRGISRETAKDVGDLDRRMDEADARRRRWARRQEE